MRFIFVYIKIVILFGGGLVGCEKTYENGTLYVHSLTVGHYEVFRTMGESSNQAISGGLAQFNKPIYLEPGNYLILGDCSSQIIKIYPNEVTNVNIHKVEFKAPIEENHADNFEIRCQRQSHVKAQQTFLNAFKLNIFGGSANLLVSTKPLSLDLATPAHKEAPQNHVIELGSIRISNNSDSQTNDSFYISNTSRLTAMTFKAVVSRYNHLLSGTYLLELNGTTKEIQINGGDILDLSPGRITFESPKGVDISLSEKITSAPIYVNFAGNHLLNINESYLAFDGEWTYAFGETQHYYKAEVKENGLVTIKPSAIRVDLNCGTWEWSCLGSKKIFLYAPNAAYHFAEGRTDVPLLFMEKSIEVAIEGTKGIRYKLTKPKASTVLKTGQVTIDPNPTYVAGNLTDLLRLEAVYFPFRGNSLDLNLTETTHLIMIEGRYRLGQYISLINTASDRWKSAKIIDVKPFNHSSIKIPVYIRKPSAVQKEKSVESQLEKRSYYSNRLLRKYRKKPSTLKMD